MDPVVASYSQLFAVQTTLVGKALGSLSEEALWKRPSPETNSVGWMVGHLACYRGRLLQLLGGQPEAHEWLALFQRGAQAGDRATYPATEEITGLLKRTNEQIKTRMAAATDEELSAVSPVSTPLPGKTVRDAIAFLAFHDAYHVGQIAFAMKLLGKPGLVG